MRHKQAGKKLGRNTSQRKALFRSLISSLILHGRIKTTLAKAKAVKRLTDKLVRKAKKTGQHTQRQLWAFLQNKQAVNKLVKEISPQFKGKQSGFTRFVRLGERRGDRAMMVRLEFVDGVGRDKSDKGEEPAKDKGKAEKKEKKTKSEKKSG